MRPFHHNPLFSRVTRWKNIPPLTRWAFYHPVQARLWLGLIQLILIFLGFWSGHMLQELGVELPHYLYVLLGGGLMVGFGLVPFWKIRKSAFLPATVNRRRTIYFLMGICMFGSMMVIGNELEQKYPDLQLTKVVVAWDDYVFEEEADITFHQAQIETAPTVTAKVFPTAARIESHKKAERLQRRHLRKMKRQLRRQQILTASTGGAVALILLLSFFACMGLCLVGGGVALMVSAAVGGGIGNALLGLVGVAAGWLISKASVKSIIRRSKRIPAEG